MTLVAGIDFGRHNDYTVAVILDNSAEPWQVVDYHTVTGGDWQTQLNQILPRLTEVSHTVADASGVGDALYQQFPNCWGCVTVSATKDSKPKLMPPDRIILPKNFLIELTLHRIRNRNLVIACKAPGLAAQLRSFHVKTGKSGKAKYEGAKNLHDDAVLGLCLAVFAGTVPASPRKLFRNGPHGKVKEAGS